MIACAGGCGGRMEVDYDPSGDSPPLTSKPVSVDGLWLVGFSSDLEHFSWLWLRDGGVVTFPAQPGVSTFVPFWGDCNGRAGTWRTDGETTALITAPTGGCLGVSPSVFQLKFHATALTPPRNVWPKAAIAVADVESSIDGAAALKAYKFPDDYCMLQGTRAFCGDP